MRRLFARLAYRLLRPEMDALVHSGDLQHNAERLLVLVENQGPRLREAIIAMVNSGIDGGRIREDPPRY